MTKSIHRHVNESNPADKDRGLSKREFGAVLAAIRSNPNAQDLNDAASIILSTGLIPEIISGIPWCDVDFDDRQMLVRSASPHRTSIQIGQPLLRRLRIRRETRPGDEYVLDSACLRRAATELGALSAKACGFQVTLNDLRTAFLKGWVRCDPRS